MTYRERREARAERLRGWADKHDDKADAAFNSAKTVADGIPFGQPILVGHHSEGHARRDRDRIDNGMRRGVENTRKAEEMRDKADNIARAAAHAIYSDDPDAAEALRAKIDKLEEERDRINAFNASCRQRKACGDTALLDDRQRADLVTIARVCSYQLRKYGQFPSYATTNLGGTINAAKKRLEKLTDA